MGRFKWVLQNSSMEYTPYCVSITIGLYATYTICCVLAKYEAATEDIMQKCEESLMHHKVTKSFVRWNDTLEFTAVYLLPLEFPPHNYIFCDSPSDICRERDFVYHGMFHFNALRGGRRNTNHPSVRAFLIISEIHSDLIKWLFGHLRIHSMKMSIQKII